MMGSNLRRFFLAIVLIAACAGAVRADGMNDLDTFIRTVKSGRADFTQVVTIPARDGQAARLKTSSGSFEFSRPGRFKFIYKKPFAQTIVADGQTLWMWDVELNQVTARKQSAVLGSTPAALIASTSDLHVLEIDFVLTAEGERDGMEWVQAMPKAKDSSLQNVRVGFRGAELMSLEILDSFGQKSALKFGNVQSNVALEAATFAFKPPPGADVIRQ